jgi:hypothetical protein
MDDYRKRGFDDGRGRGTRDPYERPVSDGDSASYRYGREDGERRREISRELDREYFGNSE